MIAPIELRTERLRLRPFRAGDVDDTLAYRDDREFARFLPHIPQPFTREDAEKHVALNLSEPWDQSPTFAVVLHNTVIGTVNLELDADKRSAMLGYAIGRVWWRQGFATEAARAVMTWGIEVFGLQRIWASTDARNVRSLRVLQKLGLRRDSIRVGDRLGRSGEPIDEVVHVLDLPR